MNRDSPPFFHLVSGSAQRHLGSDQCILGTCGRSQGLLKTKKKTDKEDYILMALPLLLFSVQLVLDMSAVSRRSPFSAYNIKSDHPHCIIMDLSRRLRSSLLLNSSPRCNPPCNIAHLYRITILLLALAGMSPLVAQLRPVRVQLLACALTQTQKPGNLLSGC